jgi:hypothetical protein
MKALKIAISPLLQSGFIRTKSIIPNYYELKTEAGVVGVGFQILPENNGVCADLTLNGSYICRAEELFSEEIISDGFWKYSTQEELLAQLKEIVDLITTTYLGILEGTIDLAAIQKQRAGEFENFSKTLNEEEQKVLEKLLAEKMEEWNQRRAGEPLPLWKMVWKEFGYNS